MCCLFCNSAFENKSAILTFYLCFCLLKNHKGWIYACGDTDITGMYPVEFYDSRDNKNPWKVINKTEDPFESETIFATLPMII